MGSDRETRAAGLRLYPQRHAGQRSASLSGFAFTLFLVLASAAPIEVPAQQDLSIPSHLAETSYEIQGFRNSELDNFLAVSRLNAHLKEPINENSALLLAHGYNESRPIYMHFSDVPGVNNIGLRNFLSILDRIRQKPSLIQNLEMGQLYSLLGWVSILGRNEVLPENKVASLFSEVGKAVQTAVSQGDTSIASMDLAKSILAECRSNPDQNPHHIRAKSGYFP